jgi:hypothetical protein
MFSKKISRVKLTNGIFKQSKVRLDGIIPSLVTIGQPIGGKAAMKTRMGLR